MARHNGQRVTSQDAPVLSITSSYAGLAHQKGGFAFVQNEFYEKISCRAPLMMAVTAGCWVLRSTEMA